MKTLDVKRFALYLALACGILSILPFLLGVLTAPAGSPYVGFQYNTDDHMVYAAWMRQAMDGHFLFDNRFAIDPQPGLTVQTYFFALGLVAKAVGIPWAAAIARAFFSGLLVLLLERLLRWTSLPDGARKLALVVTVFGGGIGFLLWKSFGIVLPADSPLAGIFSSGLPIDIWQPEGFLFPSMLVNNLFTFSLCVTVGILLCVLEAKRSWKPVPVGFLLFALLMNAHSYDILILAVLLVVFAAMQVSRKAATGAWVSRVSVMAAGAIAPALWFIHVLRHDPVFQSRAATETYTGNFRPLFAGYVLFGLLLLAFVFMQLRRQRLTTRQSVGAGLFALLVVGMLIAAGGHTAKYWMDGTTWALAIVVAGAAAVLLASESPALNLLIAWACIGFVLPYFPALFQRKLTMGLALPWGILGGIALWYLLEGISGTSRKALAALAVLLLSATSVRWMGREFELLTSNESNTTMHPTYMPPGVDKILEYLNGLSSRRTVVLAMPGIPNGEDKTPYVPDLNALISGFTGAYTFSGHWSETPDYVKRRSSTDLFFTRMSPGQALDFAHEIGATYVVAPVPEAFPALKSVNHEVHDMRVLGETVVDGPMFRLIRVRN